MEIPVFVVVLYIIVIAEMRRQRRQARLARDRRFDAMMEMEAKYRVSQIRSSLDIP